MSAHETIRCEHCGKGWTWTHGHRVTSWTVLRSILADEGWHVVRAKGALPRDICGDCWKDGKR